MFSILFHSAGFRAEIGGFFQSRRRGTWIESPQNSPVAQSRYQGLLKKLLIVELTRICWPSSLPYKTLAVEWEHIEEGEEALVSFMEKSGFVNFGKIATTYARDVIFVKDFLRFADLNFFEFLHLKDVLSISLFRDLRYDYEDYDDENKED